MNHTLPLRTSLLAGLLLLAQVVAGQVNIAAEWLAWQPNGVSSQWNLTVTNNEASYAQVYLLLKVAEADPTRAWQATTEPFALPLGQRFFRPGDVTYTQLAGIPENLHGPLQITLSLYVQGENRLLATTGTQGQAASATPEEGKQPHTSTPLIALHGQVQTAFQYIEDSLRGGASDFVRLTAAPRLEIMGVPLAAQVAYTSDGTNAWNSANAFSISFSSQELVAGVRQRLTVLADSLLPQQMQSWQVPDSLSALRDPAAWKTWAQAQGVDTSAGAYLEAVRQRVETTPAIAAGDSLYRVWQEKATTLKGYETYFESGYVQSVLKDARTQLGNPKDAAEAVAARDSLCKRFPEKCAYYRRICAGYTQIQEQAGQFEALKKQMKGIELPKDPRELRKEALSDSLFRAWRQGKGALRQVDKLASRLAAIQHLNVGVFFPVTAAPCVENVQVKGLELALLSRKNLFFSTVTGQATQPVRQGLNDSLGAATPAAWWLSANAVGVGQENGTHIRASAMVATPVGQPLGSIQAQALHTITGLSGQWAGKGKTTVLRAAVYHAVNPDSAASGQAQRGVAVQAQLRYQSPAGRAVRQQVQAQVLYVTPEFHSVAAPLMLTNRLQTRLTHSLALAKGRVHLSTTLRRDALLERQPGVHADQLTAAWMATVALPKLPRVQLGYVPTLKTAATATSLRGLLAGQWLHLLNAGLAYAYPVGKARGETSVAYARQFAPGVQPEQDSLPAAFWQATARTSLSGKQIQVSLGLTALAAAAGSRNQASADLTVAYATRAGLRLQGGGGLQQYDSGQQRWFGLAGCTWGHNRLSLSANLTYYQRTRPGLPGTLARMAVGYRI